ncbi:MAG: hypothetical protein ACLQF2_18240 [Rhodomicrobium sp.]
MFRHLRIAILPLVAAAIPLSSGMADNLPMQSLAFTSRPLILVQMFDTERCQARCKRQYDLCYNVVNNHEWVTDYKQLALDRCETDYEECVKDCLR